MNEENDPMQKEKQKDTRKETLHILLQSSYKVKASMFVMGAGQILYKQVIKGLLYLAALVVFIAYMVTSGVQDVIGFFTLGTVEGDAWLGIAGDDSVIMLLRGILAFIAIIVIILV